MADPARHLMTPEECFAWQLHQAERYELVDGLPILRNRMMTGSSTQHDRATVNIFISLSNQLRGSGCRPMTADIAIRTSIRGLRRPDVMVECAERVRDTDEAREPRLVVEVASPSTSAVDRTRRRSTSAIRPCAASSSSRPSCRRFCSIAAPTTAGRSRRSTASRRSSISPRSVRG